MIVLDGALMNENGGISPALRIVLAVFNNLFAHSDDDDREVRIADERRIVSPFADDVERDMTGQKVKVGASNAVKVTNELLYRRQSDHDPANFQRQTLDST